MVVWDKGPMGMGWHYRRSYETVLVGEKSGAACRWFDTTNKIENIVRSIRKIIPQADEHPTPKPAALASHFIALHTSPGQMVLDCFAGGGSTLEAARAGQRRAIGIEIDERYCEMAAKRLSQEVMDFGPELARCDREIAEAKARPDADTSPAYLSTLGQLDWEREKELIGHG